MGGGGGGDVVHNDAQLQIQGYLVKSPDGALTGKRVFYRSISPPTTIL